MGATGLVRNPDCTHTIQPFGPFLFTAAWHCLAELGAGGVAGLAAFCQPPHRSPLCRLLRVPLRVGKPTGRSVEVARAGGRGEAGKGGGLSLGLRLTGSCVCATSLFLGGN